MYLLFDIGGTNLRLAVSRDARLFDTPVMIPTPQDFDEAMGVIKIEAEKLSGSTVFEAVAGGVAGPLVDHGAMLVNAPNLSGWNRKPLKETLARLFGTANVRIENDTDMVGLGEALFGAAKGFETVFYMTVSTGVGGALIHHGRIFTAKYSPEPGHQIIDPTGPLAPSGSLEDYVSGAGLKRRFGKSAREIQDRKVWEECARYLAYGLHNSIVHYAPEVVVLGGSLITKPDAIPFDLVVQHLKRLMRIFPELPEIRKATLGDFGGLYGALALCTARDSAL